MSNESVMSAEDRAIHASANANKADLSQGVDVVVPRGDEGQPGPKLDPFESRKALFAKSNAMHEADANGVRAANPNLDEHVRAMEEESSGGKRREPARAPTTTASQNESPYVNVALNGRTVSVARNDVDRAGGVDLYLRQRLADEREESLAVQAADMLKQQEVIREQTEQLNVRRVEELQRQAATHDASAQSEPSRNGSQDGPRPGEQANLEAQANELASQIYSGDPADAAQAIKTILTQIQSSRTAFSAQEIASLAADQLRQQQQAATQQPTKVPSGTDPRWEAQRLAINSMAKRDFPHIDADPTLSSMARAEIQRLMSLPENSQRRSMDVAIEACENVSRSSGTDNRTEVRQMKQGLPTIPSAGGSAPGQQEETIPTGSAYVELMQRRRPGH